jgi:hypothetical protein
MTDDMKPPVSSQAIREAALKVFSLEELGQMARPQLSSLGHLIAKRLAQPGPPPTKDELEGIKELVTEHLWHGSLNKYAPRW